LHVLELRLKHNIYGVFPIDTVPMHRNTPPVTQLRATSDQSQHLG